MIVTDGSPQTFFKSTRKLKVLAYFICNKLPIHVKSKLLEYDI